MVERIQRIQKSATMRRVILVSLLLVAGIVTAYWPVGHAEFLNFDDGNYVSNNPQVFHGLSWRGVKWAFQTFHASNWHPITWLSHMADCQVFKDNASGHHWTNVGIHAANAVLLFGLLRRLTGGAARSAFVAALFALHPLHVESVAWISERKDVLCAFFFLLTIAAYQRYVICLRSAPVRKWAWYTFSLGLFIIGLMCKPMLVTLPFILLLLDWWPLNRFGKGCNVWHLLREKIPFAVLSAGSAAITFYAQDKGGAIAETSVTALPIRLANAFVSYQWYLLKTFWPVNLGPYYPYQADMPLWPGVISGILILAITVAVLSKMRRAPYLVTGWLWYIGMLVPVIGIVQVGAQTKADRYTYLPLIGIFLMVTWGMAEFLKNWRYRKVTWAGAASAIMAGCWLATFFQAQYWKNSIALFQRALAVSPKNNFLAHHNLGHALSLQGNQSEAIAHFKEAMRIYPNYPVAQYNWANSLGYEGKVDEAIVHYREALKLNPDYEQAYYNLGKALALKGNLDEAKANFQNALRCKPDYSEAMTVLGNLLLLQGQREEGMQWLFGGVQADPDNPEGHYSLASELARRKRFAEAMREFRAAIKLQPRYGAALNDLAWLLLTVDDSSIRNVPEGLRLSRKACQQTNFNDPLYLDTLAVGCSEAGDFDQAIVQSKRALEIAQRQNDHALSRQLESHLALFVEHRAYREAPKQSPPSAPSN
jgi:tetratricopeptide (TPR) repeat protein